jgi:hypothetical protein
MALLKMACVSIVLFFPCAWRLSVGVRGQAEGLNYVHQNRGIINEFENFPRTRDRSCV